MSSVEKYQLSQSNVKLQYKPEEKMGLLVVDNFPELGKLTAMRFLEWVQQNPNGVISLPTGKTPEHFIRETTRILNSWDSPEVKKEVELYGIDPIKKPEMSGLHFVQIDEFYPINPKQHNSFYNYVNRFYFEGFGLDPEKALLINCNEIGLPEGKNIEDVWGEKAVDLSLRYRSADNEREVMQKQVIANVDQWSVEFEDNIRDFGGIGFFLGGIGPDGHIGFNVRGSDMYSTTRLTEINYETMAASASDLGGIEVSRRSLVITIGLATITYNKNCVALIIAAGEAKADIIKDAITSTRNVEFPATSLQRLPKARFYITQGAAKNLEERKLAFIESLKEFDDDLIEEIVVGVSVASDKRIIDLTDADYKEKKFGRVLLKKVGKKVSELNVQIQKSLINKIEEGIKLAKDKSYLHTEPHHDDVMLGYLPYAIRHIREHSNSHHFVTFTSGFTAVTNSYMLELCGKLKSAIESDKYDFKRLLANGYFEDDDSKYRDRDVWKYLDGVAAMSIEMQEEGVLRRFLRELIVIFEDLDLENLRDRVDELINYFTTQYPGKKDLTHIQQLKGMVREFESACLWGYFGWHNDSVDNLRLGFYKGDIFTEDPTVNRDVLPVLNLLKNVNPDIVTVAFDPEASGPDTHYKVLMALSEALRMHKSKKKIEVLGYRNVWFKYEPHEANMFIPVSLNMLTLQHEAFMSTYITQKNASFPSYEYNGPFSLLAQHIQVNQYNMLKTCLGRGFFQNHPSAMLRATRGFVFLKKMYLEEFFTHTSELKRKAENK